MATKGEESHKSQENGRDSDSSRSRSPDPLDLIESSHSSFEPSSSGDSSDESANRKTSRASSRSRVRNRSKKERATEGVGAEARNMAVISDGNSSDNNADVTTNESDDLDASVVNVPCLPDALRENVDRLKQMEPAPSSDDSSDESANRPTGRASNRPMVQNRSKKRVARKARTVTESEPEVEQQPQERATERVGTEARNMADISDNNSSDNLSRLNLSVLTTYDSDDLDTTIDVPRLPDALREKVVRVIKKMEPTAEQREKLKHLDIEVHNVHRNHKMRHGLHKSDVVGRSDVRTDHFDEEEMAQIDSNWRAFCKEYDFDPTKDAFLFLPDPFKAWNADDRALTGQQKIKFRQYISQKLPNRFPGAVYFRFNAMYYFNRSGKFSSEESELIKAWHKHMPRHNIYSILSRILHRTKDSIRLRLMRMQGRKNGSKKTYVTRVRPSDDWALGDPDDRDADKYPEWIHDDAVWDEIAADSGMSVNKLMRDYFCYFYPKARATYVRPVTIDNELFQRRVIRKLVRMRPETWDDPDWEELGKCNNIGVVAAYALVRKVTKKYVPKDVWFNMSGVCDILQKEFLKIQGKSSKVRSGNQNSRSSKKTSKEKPKEPEQPDVVVSNDGEQVSIDQGGDVKELSQDDMEVTLVNRSNSSSHSNIGNTERQDAHTRAPTQNANFSENRATQNDNDPRVGLKRNLYDILDSDSEPENIGEPENIEEPDNSRRCKDNELARTNKRKMSCDSAGLHEELNASGKEISNRNELSQSLLLSREVDRDSPPKKRLKRNKGKYENFSGELDKSAVPSSPRPDESAKSSKAEGSDFQVSEVLLHSEVKGGSSKKKKVRENKKMRYEEVHVEEELGVSSEAATPSQKKKRHKRKKGKYEEDTEQSDLEVPSHADSHAEEFCNNSLSGVEELSEDTTECLSPHNKKHQQKKSVEDDEQPLEQDELGKRRRRKKGELVEEVSDDLLNRSEELGVEVEEVPQKKKKGKKKENEVGKLLAESDKSEASPGVRVDKADKDRSGSRTSSGSYALLGASGEPENVRHSRSKENNSDPQESVGLTGSDIETPPKKKRKKRKNKEKAERCEFKVPNAARIDETIGSSSVMSDGSQQDSGLLFSDVEGASPRKDKVRKKKKRKHGVEEQSQESGVDGVADDESCKRSLIPDGRDFLESLSNTEDEPKHIKRKKLKGSKQHAEEEVSSLHSQSTNSDLLSTAELQVDATDRLRVSGKTTANYTSIMSEETRSAEVTPEKSKNCLSPELFTPSGRQSMCSTRGNSVETDVAPTESGLVTKNNADNSLKGKLLPSESPSPILSSPGDGHDSRTTPQKKASKIGSSKKPERLSNLTQSNIKSWLAKTKVEKDERPLPPQTISGVNERRKSPRKNMASKMSSPKISKTASTNSSHKEIESWLAKQDERPLPPQTVSGVNERRKSPRKNVATKMSSPKISGTPSRNSSLIDIDSWLVVEFMKAKEAEEVEEDGTSPSYLAPGTLSKEASKSTDLENDCGDLTGAKHPQTSSSEKKRSPGQEMLRLCLSPIKHFETGEAGTPKEPDKLTQTGGLDKDSEDAPKQRTSVLGRLRNRPDRNISHVEPQKKVYPIFEKRRVKTRQAAPVPNNTSEAPSQNTTQRLRNRPKHPLIRKPIKVVPITTRSRR